MCKFNRSNVGPQAKKVKNETPVSGKSDLKKKGKPVEEDEDDDDDDDDEVSSLTSETLGIVSSY